MPKKILRGLHEAVRHAQGDEVARYQCGHWHQSPTDAAACHLAALRNANDGWAITVWKDGSWKLWRTLDAKYAEADPEWLSTLRGTAIVAEIESLSTTGHKMTP